MSWNNSKPLKRLLDLLVATTAFVCLTPLAGIIALVIFIRMGRPIFFCQERPGYHTKPFVLIKFRTMSNQKDIDGQLFTDEMRLTSLGRFLRSTSLDELPELLNILKGEMSLVGPRPLMISYLDKYSPDQARRHEVIPGMTGWAQINGRNATSWAKRLAMDVWYVDHWSLGLDLKILAVTFWKVLKREGISYNDHATMPAFKGAKHEIS